MGISTGYIKYILAVGPWCFTDPQSSRMYQGNTNMTATGKPCQRWDSQHPHSHTVILDDFPDGSLEDASNYCRDPGGIETWPWCYTMTPTRWEYCSVQDIVCRKYHREETFRCVDINYTIPNSVNFNFALPSDIGGGLGVLHAESQNQAFP